MVATQENVHLLKHFMPTLSFARVGNNWILHYIFFFRILQNTLLGFVISDRCIKLSI